MRELTYAEALREGLRQAMTADPRVFMIGEDIGVYGGAFGVTAGLLQEFGAERVIDTPIAELGFTGIAVGAAMNGLRPIVEFMTWNFAVLASDQIINHAAKMLQMSGGQFHVPIVFRGGNGSAGQLAATHSQSFEAMYANVPGLKVVTPSNPYDAKGLLKASIRDNDPVLFMESERMYGDKGEIPDGEYLLPIGKADVKREGKDVTIVSFGKMMKVALSAADELKKEGIDAEVIDLRTIRPLDHATVLASVRKTNRLVVVDENWPVASISSEIAYRVQKDAFDSLDAPVLRVNQADTPLPFAPGLIDASLPSVARTVQAVKEVMYLVK